MNFLDFFKILSIFFLIILILSIKNTKWSWTSNGTKTDFSVHFKVKILENCIAKLPQPNYKMQKKILLLNYFYNIHCRSTPTSPRLASSKVMLWSASMMNQDGEWELDWRVWQRRRRKWFVIFQYISGYDSFRNWDRHSEKFTSSSRKR